MNEHPSQHRFKRLLSRRIVISALLLILLGLFVAENCAIIRRPRFIRHWIERFHGIENLEGARELERSKRVFVRELPSGEWILATCEHSCCSGAGFNATVIRDSTGAIYTDTTHSFCGLMGMASEFAAVPSDNLAGFYSRLTQLQLEKQ